MSKHVAAGRSIATAATADHCAAQIWNPAAAQGIYVNAVSWFHTVGTADNSMLSRSSARGATPNNTVTPDADNDYAGEGAPQTAWVLEMGTFTTQPTLATPPLFRTIFGAAVGAGIIVPFGEGHAGLYVGPGTGLCIATPVAVILQPLDVTVWITD